MDFMSSHTLIYRHRVNVIPLLHRWRPSSKRIISPPFLPRSIKSQATPTIPTITGIIDTRQGGDKAPEGSDSSSYRIIDPRADTTGRWLRNDKLQRQARYIKFDFGALYKKALAYCPGALSFKSCDEIDGDFNRVFIFKCDNGRQVVARLPTSVAGPPRLLTNSDVATIKYLQSTTSVAIPTILDWNDDPSNPIGSEYVIMEPARGVILSQMWPKMSGAQQIRCIRSIMENIQQVANLKIPAYGSLYFADAPVHSASKQDFMPGFCVGPSCDVKYGARIVGENRYYDNIEPNRGPWLDLAAYCDGLIDTGLSRLPPQSAEAGSLERLPYRGDTTAHAELLGKTRDVLHEMSEDPRIRNSAAPTLYHPNLSKGNIFVSEADPTVVTDIIDWQSASAEPAFMYADQNPDFASIAPGLSSNAESMKTDARLCAGAFQVCVHYQMPQLAASRRLDEDLLRPFRYCHRTWKDGIAAFRSELISVARRWKEPELPGFCPYPLPPAEELLAHQNAFKSFEVAQDLQEKLMDLLEVDEDGWVFSERWEVTNALHREIFNTMIQVVKDAEGTEDGDITAEEVKKIWPFDLPSRRQPSELPEDLSALLQMRHDLKWEEDAHVDD